MCHSRDFRAFAVRKEQKPDNVRSAEDRRAEVIGTLLGGASKPGQEARPERTPAKEPIAAK